MIPPELDLRNDWILCDKVAELAQTIGYNLSALEETNRKEVSENIADMYRCWLEKRGGKPDADSWMLGAIAAIHLLLDSYQIRIEEQRQGI